ncbi:hypothetical protein [Brevibacillus borstelensis]|uniref:hypothetical protein n=1 Tax=Brevibacillus borstelensis TaxID=45462 RepID=UPI003CE7FC4B
MFTVQPEGFEAISDCARRFQEDVEKLAERFSLEVDGRFPAMELHVHPRLQATLEYALWGEAGVVAVKGKLNALTDDLIDCKTISVTMKFSLSCDPQTDIEWLKQRIEEILYGEVELFWHRPPAGHIGHIELTIAFQAEPGASRMNEYVRCVLGIVTGKMMAA